MRAALPEIDRVEVSYDPGGSGSPDAPRRKPRPGMLLDAADTLRISLTESYMVGDRWRDIDCGHAAGSATVFIDRGYKRIAAPDADVHGRFVRRGGGSHLVQAVKNTG